MHLSELKAQHISALIQMAESLEIESASRLRKQELMFAIMKKRARQGEQIFGDGVLEVFLMVSAFCVRRTRVFSRPPTTSTCRRARSAVSISTPAT